jgi:uncharacterized membrane protein YfcA
VGFVRVTHDRRERAVDVEQDRGSGRVGAQRTQRFGGPSGGFVGLGSGRRHLSSMPGRMPPAAAGRTLKLAVIGTGAGVFSGLFGVGGGSVIVPLLILWLAYGEREATGTSLAAIVAIAGAAAIWQARHGNVDVPRAVLVGLPALVGVVAGTWVQQRIPADVIGLLFSLLLVAVAVKLIVG